VPGDLIPVRMDSAVGVGLDEEHPLALQLCDRPGRRAGLPAIRPVNAGQEDSAGFQEPPGFAQPLVLTLLIQMAEGRTGPDQIKGGGFKRGGWQGVPCDETGGMEILSAPVDGPRIDIATCNLQCDRSPLQRQDQPAAAAAEIQERGTLSQRTI